MRKYSVVAVPTYAVALILIAFPLLEATLSVWPLRWSVESWRFGAVGQFSRALMSPLLGLLLAYIVAHLLEHRWIQYLHLGISAVAGVILAGVVAVFTLDALQLRAIVAPEAKASFDVATLVAFGKCVIAFLVLLSFAVFGHRGRSHHHSERGQRARGEGNLPQLISRRRGRSEHLASADTDAVTADAAARAPMSDSPAAATQASVPSS